MNILVFSGSPKGKISITYQTVRFLEKKFKSDVFTTLFIGQKIKSYEKDFEPVLEAVKAADLLLFVYPVYTFTVPYQVARFIDLLKEKCPEDILRGKAATQITTSKHFFDVTAHEFIKQNCLDLNLDYYDGLSSDMDDLLKLRGQKEAADFWRYLHYQIAYKNQKINSVSKERQKNKFRVMIITDLSEEDEKLKEKITSFQNLFPYTTEVFNTAEFKFANGCTGCLRCTSNGNCIHKDGFQQYLNGTINTADAFIYAFTIKNHSMGTNLKCFDDRQFCNGHRTLSVDKPNGYIINGNLENEQGLKMVIQGRLSVGKNPLAHLVHDGEGSVQELSDKLTYMLENPVVQPQNFYGSGGTKIFRDLIYLMSGMMKADYKFFRENHMFDDYPQNQKKRRTLMYIVGAMNSNPKLMAKIGSRYYDGMLSPYNKVIDSAEEETLEIQ